MLGATLVGNPLSAPFTMPKNSASKQKALAAAGFWPMLPKAAVAVGKFCTWFRLAAARELRAASWLREESDSCVRCAMRPQRGNYS